MSSLKCKVGDKVWVEYTVALVDRDDSHYTYRLRSGDNEEIWVSAQVVQTFPQIASTIVNNVQVSDVVTNQGKFYTVDMVANDRVYVERNGYSYLMKKDIEAIYRNVYTKKKKCVEEMTREELLEYVKQLEGGVNG